MPRLHPLDPDLVASLVRRRRALGWSQNDLALAAGLTEAFVQRMETLRYPVSPEKRNALERALAKAEHETAVPA
jgi:ribosome-binding protein aMBF1 (putative translation factor)